MASERRMETRGEHAGEIAGASRLRWLGSFRHDANGSGRGSDAGRRGTWAGVDGAAVRGGGGGGSAPLMDARRSLEGCRASRGDMFASAPLIDARRCFEWVEVIEESDWQDVSPLIDARRCFERSEVIGEGDWEGVSPLIDARRCFEWSEVVRESVSEDGARRKKLEVTCVAREVAGLREGDLGRRAATSALLADDSSPD